MNPTYTGLREFAETVAAFRSDERYLAVAARFSVRVEELRRAGALSRPECDSLRGMLGVAPPLTATQR
jgi:hypothetical protein